MITNIKKIQGSGFLSFKNDFQLLLHKYPNQTVQIDGVNLDDDGSKSNGSGKSSLLEAISWGLYGKLSRRNKLRDETIHKTSKEAKVIITFDQKEVEFIITRSIGRKKEPHLIITNNGNKILEGATYQKKQEELEKILGMSFVAFQCSVMFGRDFMNFPDLKPGERAKILSDIRGLDKYLDSSKKATEIAKSITATIQDLVEKVEKEEGKLEGLRLTTYTQDMKDFEQQRDEKIREIQESISFKKKTLKEVQNVMEKKAVEIDEKISSIQTTIKNLDSKINKKEAITKYIAFIQKEVSEWKADLNSFIKQRNKLAEDTRKITEYGEGECPFCAQKITGKHIEAIQMVNMGEIKVLNKEIKTLEEQIKISSAVIDENNEQLDKINQLEKERKNHQSSIFNLEVERERVLQNKEEVTLVTQINGLTAALIEKRKEENPYLKKEEERKEAIKSVGNRLRLIRAEKEKQVEERKYYEVWTDGFKKIRMSLFKTMTDQIGVLSQNFLSRYSSELNIIIDTERETQSGTIKEELYIGIVDSEGRELSYEMYSGGEKQKVRLAVSRALAQFISDGCGIDFNFIAFDEPNDALDDVGKETNFLTFEELSEKENKTVLVTDHDANFKDRFGNSILVTKEKGESRISYE